MKRVIRLTESDLTRIVRRVLKESRGVINEGTGTIADLCNVSGQFYNEEACETFGSAKTLQQVGQICYNERKGVVDILRKNLEKYATQTLPVSQEAVTFFEDGFKKLDMISYIGLSFAVWNNGIGGTPYSSISDVINKMLPCEGSRTGSARSIPNETRDYVLNNNQKNSSLHSALEPIRDQIERLTIFDKITYANGCSSPRSGGGTFG
jgi:hypothetical protein